MAHIGEQDDGTWVLGNDAFFSSDGRVIPAESSQYVWLGAMFRGTGVVSGHQQRCIQFPLSTDPLASLLHALHSSMAHNFYPCLLTMAGRYHFPIKSILLYAFVPTGTIMALHYRSFISKLTNCPVTIAYGKSGTGKTISIHCALGLLGANDSRLFHNVSPAKAFELCSTTSIPMGYDDPDTKKGFSSLIIDGARKATISAGEQIPKSTVIISSNIAPIDQQRLLITSK